MPPARSFGEAGAEPACRYPVHEGDGPEAIGFLLVPQFSMMAFVSAVEPLRVANRLAGRPLFAWRTYSADGGPVEGSNGMTMVVEGPLDRAAALSTLFVCAGFEPCRAVGRPLIRTLRRLARSGLVLGALDTGTHVLARAGLIGGVAVTMHWEAVPGFREDYPDILVTDELFEVAEGRITCAGGTAAIDMMLDMIGAKHGSRLAVDVSEQFIHGRIRDRHDRQRMEPARRLGITDTRLVRILEEMESHLDEPRSARRLAAAAGLSSRQLERLFRAHLGSTPSAFYLGLRLTRARQLLRQTDLPVLDVAAACGFTSSSCLSRSYRARFGTAPSRDRREG